MPTSRRPNPVVEPGEASMSAHLPVTDAIVIEAIIAEFMTSV
jgi:hypothetical protein